MSVINLAEKRLLPDAVIRLGIRRLLKQRLQDERADDLQAASEQKNRCIEMLRQSPIAIETDAANEQHYEVSPAFFEHVLGPRHKYSCGLWADGVNDLAQSEEAMLALCCERAELSDGQSVLDLGCGWGSLSIWIAEHYPKSQILAVSNSKPQRDFILARCDQIGLTNVEVVTADVNAFAPDRRFDRVMSIEMFEHVRNHELLLSRIASWLEPTGKLFVHHFSHRDRAYPFETEGEDDWMGRQFFSGGMMPSDDLLLHCQRDLLVEEKWHVNGVHYQKTSDAWLARQDERRDELLPILAEIYGAEDARLWNQRWRLFFLACSELFGYRQGNEWWVTHVRMTSRGGGA